MTTFVSCGGLNASSGFGVSSYDNWFAAAEDGASSPDGRVAVSETPNWTSVSSELGCLAIASTDARDARRAASRSHLWT